MKIKKFVTSFLFFLLLASSVLGIKLLYEINTVDALGESQLQAIEQTTKLPTFETNVHSKASIQPGASNITSAIYYVLDFMKLLVGSIAVVMIIFIGIKLIMARKKINEVWPKQKEHLIMIAVGIVFIFIADVAVRKVFFGEEGEIYETQAQAQEAAREGTLQLKGMYNVAMMLAGAIAVLMLIVAGIRLLTSGGNDEVQTKVKKQITWIVLGLFLVGVAEFVVQDFIFPKQGAEIPSAQKGRQLIVDFTNFFSAFVSIAAVISSIYGGYLYVTAFENEDQTGKAKRVIKGAIIALFLALAAFAIVNAVIQVDAG
jgi:cytochrome bd-type quinol oxidase subunit 2